MASASSNASDPHSETSRIQLDPSLDPTQAEQDILRLISPFEILIGNPSNQYAALLKSLTKKHPGFRLIGVCQTSEQLMHSIRTSSDALMVVSLSHLLDGSMHTLARALIDQNECAHLVLILKRNEKIYQFKNLIKAGSAHIVDESSIGIGGMLRCLQSISSGEVYKDLAALRRLEEESESRTSLSERELEVIRLVADGLSNREIGERLMIAHVTARDHVNRVMRKLGAKDRTEAAVIGMRLGLVD